MSCFGGENESDTGDYWKWELFLFLNKYLDLNILEGGLYWFQLSIVFRVIIEGSGKTWKQDQRIRLQHVDTGGYLHSHDKKYSRIAGGQQEVRNCLEYENLLYSLLVLNFEPTNVWIIFLMLTAFSLSEPYMFCIWSIFTVILFYFYK